MIKIDADNNMINVDVDRKNESVTFSSIIRVQDRYIRLHVTRLLYYAEMPIKPEGSLLENPTFERCFYFPKEYYTNPERNHFVHHRFLDNEFRYKSEKIYEVQYNEIQLLRDRKEPHSIILSDGERSYPVAVPQNLWRYDYITVDGRYLYDRKKGSVDGIEIVVGSMLLTPENKTPESPKEITRILIKNVMVNGKEVECYFPEAYDGHKWISLLKKGEHILKNGNNPLDVCKKCAGSGKNCYLNSLMELAYDGKPCLECKGIGLRKGASADNIRLAEIRIKEFLNDLKLFDELKNKYR